MEENELKKQVLSCLSEHFKINKEAEGLFEFEGEERKVYADFLIEPTEETIEKFDLPKGKYIIEAKHINSFTIPNLSNLFIQCLTYKKSKFNNEFPIGVFIFTDLDYTFQPETKDSKMLEVLLCTFGRLNIGRLELNDNDFSFLLHKGDILFRFKKGRIIKVRKDLLNISFGSGNNKLSKKY